MSIDLRTLADKISRAAQAEDLFLREKEARVTFLDKLARLLGNKLALRIDGSLLDREGTIVRMIEAKLAELAAVHKDLGEAKAAPYHVLAGNPADRILRHERAYLPLTAEQQQCLANALASYSLARERAGKPTTRVDSIRERLCAPETDYARLVYPGEHAGHGQGSAGAGPDDPDCPCRDTEHEEQCMREGCGFCIVSWKAKREDVNEAQREQIRVLKNGAAALAAVVQAIGAATGASANSTPAAILEHVRQSRPTPSVKSMIDALDDIQCRAATIHEPDDAMDVLDAIERIAKQALGYGDPLTGDPPTKPAKPAPKPKRFLRVIPRGHTMTSVQEQDWREVGAFVHMLDRTIPRTAVEVIEECRRYNEDYPQDGIRYDFVTEPNFVENRLMQAVEAGFAKLAE